MHRNHYGHKPPAIAKPLNDSIGRAMRLPKQHNPHKVKFHFGDSMPSTTKKSQYEHHHSNSSPMLLCSQTELGNLQKNQSTTKSLLWPQHAIIAPALACEKQKSNPLVLPLAPRRLPQPSPSPMILWVVFESILWWTRHNSRADSSICAVREAFTNHPQCRQEVFVILIVHTRGLLSPRTNKGPTSRNLGFEN